MGLGPAAFRRPDTGGTGSTRGSRPAPMRARFGVRIRTNRLRPPSRHHGELAPYTVLGVGYAPPKLAREIRIDLLRLTSFPMPPSFQTYSVYHHGKRENSK
jgi:hypothetical protein